MEISSTGQRCQSKFKAKNMSACPHRAFSVGLTVICSILLAAGPSTAQKKTAETRSLLRAMKAARGEVFAGIVAIEVKKFESKGVVHESRTLYFDKATGCMRCDRKVTSAAPGTRSFECTLVETPQEVLFYSGDTGVVSRHPAGSRVESIKARPSFDPLAVGLGSAAVYQGKYHFKAITDALLQRPVRSLSVRDGVARVELEGHGADDEYLFHLTIDVENGHTPTSYSEVHVSHKGTAVGRTMSKASAVWSVVNDTYVPSQWDIVLYDERYATVKLSWSSVNQKLPQKMFSIAGIPMPKGTTIVNHRSGAAVIEGKTD